MNIFQVIISVLLIIIMSAMAVVLGIFAWYVIEFVIFDKTKKRESDIQLPDQTSC